MVTGQVSRSSASFIAAQVMTETGLSIFAERIPIEQLTVDKKGASTFNDRFPLLSGDRDVDRAFSVKDPIGTDNSYRRTFALGNITLGSSRRFLQGVNGNGAACPEADVVRRSLAGF